MTFVAVARTSITQCNSTDFSYSDDRKQHTCYTPTVSRCPCPSTKSKREDFKALLSSAAEDPSLELHVIVSLRAVDASM